MANLLKKGARFLEDNPAIYRLLCGEKEISATIMEGEKNTCRIFKGINDSKFYAESFPQEGNEDISVECAEDLLFANKLAEINYEDFIITH